jgi:hypothetical protein
MGDAKQWWESSGVWGALGTVVAGLVAAFGYAATGIDVSITEIGLSLAGAVSGIVALRGRIKATKRIS